MKKQIIWLGALFVVLALAGCGNKAPQGDQNKPVGEPGTTNLTVQKNDNSGGIFSGSLKDLMTKGEDAQCTWSSGSDVAKSSGTVYVNGNKFYQEFSTTQGELGEIKSYILNDGEWVYQWNSMSKMGTKMQASEVKKMADDAQKNSPIDMDIKPNEEGRRNIDLNNKVDYNCQKWNVDASKFVLPSDIQFNDLSQMLNNMPKAIDGQTKIDVCQMCDKLPAEGKAACLQNCNK